MGRQRKKSSTMKCSVYLSTPRLRGGDGWGGRPGAETVRKKFVELWSRECVRVNSLSEILERKSTRGGTLFAGRRIKKGVEGFEERLSAGKKTITSTEPIETSSGKREKKVFGDSSLRNHRCVSLYVFRAECFYEGQAEA